MTNKTEKTINRIVKIRRNHERFWVTNVHSEFEYLIGEVNNDLVHEHPFECGDTIKFTEEEIIEEWEEH